jgi:putative glutamine amidotransferase
MATSMRSNGPVIGLSAYHEQARWGPWEAPATLLPGSYAGQVAAAGGIPVLLPPLPGVAGSVGRLDGLVLTGGGDIDPAAYGARPHPRTTRVDHQRDRAELELVTAALEAGLPVLGICRGLQVLNVARGGTLHQHVPDLPAPYLKAEHSPGPGRYGSHQVHIAPGSRLAGIFGTGGPRGDPRLDVPTAHHQAIDKLGSGLTATAWADDGVIEAVEMAPGPGRHPFVLAVQWHPEAGDDPRLMLALVAAAGAPLGLAGSVQPGSGWA